MVVNLARALANIGHDVTVYCSLVGDHYIDGDVTYLHRNSLKNRELSGILIAFKDVDALLLDGFHSRYMWTADPQKLNMHHRERCDGLFAISKWHQGELESLNIGYDKIGCIFPGFDPDIVIAERIDKQCLFASSPDRGLDDLILMWPKIIEAHPEAHLKITYIKHKHEEFDNMEFLGRVSNEEMSMLYRQSDLLLYPCKSGERFCYVVLQAQHYGCIPVTTPTMALSETNKHGVKSLKYDFVSVIIRLMGSAVRRQELREECQKVSFYTWDQTAKHWEKLIGQRTPSIERH